MRKFVFLVTLITINCSAFAQLKGQFGYGNDGHIYFYLHNPTPYYITIAYGPINYDTEETRSYGGTMAPQQTYAFGPNAGWIWLKGEVFLVTYPNGESAKWECPYNDPSVNRRSNVSFGDSDCSKYRDKKCSVQGPYDAVPCNCYGFRCNHWDASVCDRCKHPATKHNR